VPSNLRESSLDVLTRFFRPGRVGTQDVRIDLFWLLGLGLVMIGVGLGFRDPWPADEPRFALVASDMVRFGQWLFPQIGGDWYADKPPVFFWLIAAFYVVTGSLRIAFLLPSLLAGLASLVLIYDLLRRVWNREVAFTGAWLLLITFQFVWQARQAQIDAVLCFWTTLSMYGFLRHLLTGPRWNWYAIGWAAAGFGIITKGVGFLPLLLLAVYAVLRRTGWSHGSNTHGRIQHWAWGPLAFLAAVGVWLVPMLLSATTPDLIAYRDEILFHQTINRYAAAWHHHRPFWYFIVEVIPPLWLPLSALIPWLWPRWRAAFKAKDMRIALPLLWVLVVLVFFSASPGKRGVYILPALPALVIASAPWLSELINRQGPKRLFFVLSVFLATVFACGAAYLFAVPGMRAEVLGEYGVDGVGPLSAAAVAAAIWCALFRIRSAPIAFTAALATILVVAGIWVNPALNADRSGLGFIARVEEAARDVPELGIVGYKEQYLLHFTRPTVNFGHARWTEGDHAEASDAAAWLARSDGRAVLAPEWARDACFPDARSIDLGSANSNDWYLVFGPAKPDCIADGDLKKARVYVPPSASNSSQ